MSKSFEDLLKSAIEYNITSEVLEYTKDLEVQFNEINIPNNKYQSISKKMLMLPPKAIFILFSKYCFMLNPSDVKVFFDINNPSGYLFHYRKIVSYFAGCNENEILSSSSMTDICKIALKDYMKQDFNINKTTNVVFLPKFGQNIKKIRKSIAVAACIAIMTFSTSMVVNAEFREKVVTWVIETFEKYSIFELKSEEKLTIQELQKYSPQYITDGFQLQNMTEQPSLILYEYISEYGNTLNIFMSVSDTKIYFDTEGITLDKIEISEATGYYFEKDKLKHMIFERDGFYFAVYGSISKSELMAIAEGIKK